MAFTEPSVPQRRLMAVRLTDLALLFAKIGVTGFGGPAAHIAMMEDEVVVRRKWMARQHFLDLVGATNLIPGPNSTEMTMHVGLDRAGPVGLVLAGTSFILPAALLSAVIAAAYIRYGALPQVEDLLAGIRPVVLVIILSAIARLGSKAVRDWRLLALAALVGAATLLGFSEVLALFTGGLVGMIWLRGRSGLADRRGLFTSAALVMAAIGGVTGLLLLANNMMVPQAPADDQIGVPLWQLGLYFLFVGSVLYGSGYVLFAFLQGGLVQTLGWISPQQLVDAVAVGQVTPGPVFSAATFVGYLVGGWRGAAVASLAIFLPAFVFVALLNPLVPRMRSSAWMAAFLDAVNAGSIGLMTVVLLQMAPGALGTWQAAAIFAGAALLAWRWNLNSAWLVAGGGAVGWLLFRFTS